ncbi:hypothetical protein [Paraburkholderia lycopersici]|uniref:PXPV repeat-containing protein n=1 Tax=Paraburkholderia lycopersici TaxID=416944 RepID=A0A1G7BYT8_9BURK|nr:hypothetical protein [Paraburkholderia lycopersici]SDE32222.1 hypothetical protein SAMN05421548_1424 [Paraburkholderia lycopersici]
MNRMIPGVVLGVAALAVSAAASAHVDVAMGFDVPGPGYAPVQPAYTAAPPAAYAAALVATDWRDDDDWRARQWREHEWREHERREHQWREREWHDRDRWGY